MGHIFTSYSHKDTKYAHDLADHLKTAGFDVWIDERLDYGSQWPHEIQKQLDSCEAFILIMSPRSFASDWVQSELQRAKRKLKPIFPLLLEGEEPWLSVESTQYYDVRGGLFPDDRFYAAIKRVVFASPHMAIGNRLPKHGIKADAPRPKMRTEVLVAMIGGMATVIAACATMVGSLMTWINPGISYTQSSTPFQVTRMPPSPVFTRDLSAQITSVTPSDLPASFTPTNVPTSTLPPTFPPTALITATSTSDLPPAGFYNVRPKHSGMCLGIWGGSLDYGALVVQATCDGSSNQRWQLVPEGAGYYNVRPEHSGMCLGVTAGLTNPGTEVVQATCDGTPNQLWQLVPKGTDYYNVLPKHSGQCLGILSSSLDYGAKVVQAVCDETPNQRWEFISAP